MKAVLVVPNHLPHLDVLDAWADVLGSTPVIVVQDVGPKPRAPAGLDVTIVDHDDIAAALGSDAWIIPSQTSACRSYGYYLAWQRRPDYIVTIDTDCYPDGSNLLWGHAANLRRNVTLDWVNSGAGLYYRGFPYRIRDASPVTLSHGLWSGVPDFDAATWLHNPNVRLRPADGTRVIPRHSFFPMCGMNLAWRTELTPAMYFGLFGPAYGFDQYDDIWAGVLVKRVMDHLGLAAISGYPSVEHRKQSNVYVNLVKQAPGLAMNEHFWREVQRVPLTATTIAGTYRQLIEGLPDVIADEPQGYTVRLKLAALTWVGLYE
ncbi:MAG: hypothetical protein IT341_10740 [Chloroflexi bacterium]|nr:hypothetical protein [Chloroflexota bacterium]